MRKQKLFTLLIIMLILTPSIFLASCGGNCNTNERYLVVTTFAGMANRLRVLTSAKIMAALTDRHLVVDWPILANEMPGQWKDFFLNPLITYENSGLGQQGCSLRSIKNAAADDPFVKNLGSQNDSTKVLSKLPEISENIIYFGTSLEFNPEEKALSDSDYKERRKLFYKTLDPTKWITDEVNNFKKDNKFENYFMIGVHYRSWQTGAPDVRSVLTADPENRFLPDFIEKMKKALALPLDETGQKPVAFFLSTDNQKAKDEMLAVPELKGRIYVRSNKADRSTIRGQASDMVDFFLLGSTNYIIGTAVSSFSDEAAHLTKEDRKDATGDNPYKF